MNVAERSVQVTLRGLELSPGAVARECEDHIFVELDQPPPVGSIVALTDDEGNTALVEVSAVVEVPGETPRGFAAVEPSEEALERSRLVGSEPFEPGEIQPVVAEERSDQNTPMGTPAPVLEPEPSELIEVYGFSDVGLQVGHEDELDDGGTPQPNPDDSVSDSSRID